MHFLILAQEAAGTAQNASEAAQEPQTLQDWANLGIDLAVEYGPKVIGVLVFIFVAWIIAGWTSRITGKALERGRIDLTLTRFISNMVRWVVLLMAGIACLGVFGIETTSFAAVIAAAGFAIGLAFQGSLSNLSAGVMLLVFRPFKIGDAVTAAGQTGKIFEIDLFATKMDTFDNRRLVIPNSAIFGGTIENITYHPTRRVDVPVGTEYPADLDRVRTVLESAAQTVEGRLDDPAPAVVLLDLGGSSIDWSVRVWAKTSEFWDVRQRLVRDCKKALDDAGIGIPFPQMDVHLFRDDAGDASSAA